MVDDDAFVRLNLRVGSSMRLTTLRASARSFTAKTEITVEGASWESI
jgi:hypothetical protein